MMRSSAALLASVTTVLMSYPPLLFAAEQDLRRRESGGGLELSSHYPEIMVYQPAYFRVRMGSRMGGGNPGDRVLWLGGRRADTQDGLDVRIPIDPRAASVVRRPTEDGRTDLDFAVLLAPQDQRTFPERFVFRAPGAYDLWCWQGEDGATSNRVTLNVAALPDAVEAAMPHYLRKEVIAMGITGKAYGGSLEHVRVLLSRWPKSPYASWLSGSFGLARFKTAFDKHNIQGGEEVYGPIVPYLATCVERPERSLVNEELHFYLAYAQALIGDYDAATKTVAGLSAKYPAGRFRRQAKQLVTEISAVQERAK